MLLVLNVSIVIQKKKKNLLGKRRTKESDLEEFVCLISFLFFIFLWDADDTEISYKNSSWFQKCNLYQKKRDRSNR